jgi:hypothetical protein
MAFGMHKPHVTFPLTSRGAHTNPPAFPLKSKAHPQRCTQIMSNPSHKIAGKQQGRLTTSTKKDQPTKFPQPCSHPKPKIRHPISSRNVEMSTL